MEMIRLAKLNHYDQPNLYGIKGDNSIEEFNHKHKLDLLSNWNDTSFIIGPNWELN